MMLRRCAAPFHASVPCVVASPHGLPDIARNLIDPRFEITRILKTRFLSQTSSDDVAGCM